MLKCKCGFKIKDGSPELNICPGCALPTLDFIEIRSEGELNDLNGSETIEPEVIPE